jgi:hypothetical protein
MPVLVLAVSEDFDKLLENRGLTPIAALSKPRRVMVMAINVSFVFIVAILGTEHGRANRTGEVLDMIFALQSCDVGSPKSAAASVA